MIYLWVSERIGRAVRPANDHFLDVGPSTQAKVDRVWMLGLVRIACNNLAIKGAVRCACPYFCSNRGKSRLRSRELNANPVIGGFQLVQVKMQAVAARRRSAKPLPFGRIPKKRRDEESDLYDGRCTDPLEPLFSIGACHWDGCQSIQPRQLGIDFFRNLAIPNFDAPGRYRRNFRVVRDQNNRAALLA